MVQLKIISLLRLKSGLLTIGKFKTKKFQFGWNMKKMKIKKIKLKIQKFLTVLMIKKYKLMNLRKKYKDSLMSLKTNQVCKKKISKIF